jgi:hypothetical protein
MVKSIFSQTGLVRLTFTFLSLHASQAADVRWRFRLSISARALMLRVEDCTSLGHPAPHKLGKMLLD